MYCRPLWLFLLVIHPLAPRVSAQARAIPCKECAAWNASQEPFKVYGNTYYVGTHGLSSILITSAGGHVLIDGALPESAPKIAANIRALGFRIEDVKLILNSHVHFDHAGGIAELQKRSGAHVAASKWTADVMHDGAVPRDDPQFGIIEPIAPVARVEILQDRETLRAGGVAITAHSTPGHTAGGTSWTWRSCEGGRCLDMVYADSMTAVSADGYQFTRRKDHPNRVDDFERTFAFFESTPCDIVLTPHPDFSSLWERLAKRTSNPDAMIDRGACKALAKTARERLARRVATERGN